jgi:hypothetical protein
MFIVTAALSMTVYRVTNPRINAEKEAQKSFRSRVKEYRDCPATQQEMKAKGFSLEGGNR